MTAQEIRDVFHQSHDLRDAILCEIAAQFYEQTAAFREAIAANWQMHREHMASQLPKKIDHLTEEFKSVVSLGARLNELGEAGWSIGKLEYSRDRDAWMFVACRDKKSEGVSQ